MKYSVEYLGNLRTRSIHLDSGSEIMTDAPKDNQGLGEAFSPTDLFAVSLASCMLTLMGIAAKKLKLDLEGASMQVEKTMQSNPRRIGSIVINFTCPLEVDPEHKLILEKAAHDCPVHHSIHPDIIVKTTYVWGS